VPVPAGDVTEIALVTAPLGTVVEMRALERTLNGAGLVPNLTLVAPQKPDPVSVTERPVIPDVGVNEEIVGAMLAVTGKACALRTVPVGAAVLVTVIGPLLAPDGTGALSSLADTSVATAAAVPLNFAVELELNPTPVMVTTVPAGPQLGPNPVIDSGTPKPRLLVPVPAASVTDSLPVTAPLGTTAFSPVVETNVAGDDAVVPNSTFVPGTKLVPVSVTLAPVIPDAGANEVTVGGP
jgi:hypothetical protein